MALTVSYTHKDFATLVEYLKVRATEFAPNWTDFLDDDLGFALMKTFAAAADMNNFYLDRQAAESFLLTCEYRDTAVVAAKALGYDPRGVSPASTTIRVSITGPYSEVLVIPAGTSMQIAGKIFTTTDSGIIPQGSLETTITAIQGQPYSSLTLSPGSRWFKTQHPKNLANAVVMVDSVTWSRVESFVFPEGVRNAYRIYEDRAAVVVMFGGGINTAYPSAGQTILVTGITCDGVSGNVGQAGAAVTILSPIYDSLNNNVVNLFGAQAVTAPSGGADADTLEEIKAKAPAFYTTQNRAVIADDYQYLAANIPGVIEAVAWGGEEVGQYGNVFVCVAGPDRANVSQALLDAVATALELKKTIPMIVNVVAPVPVTMDLSVDLFVNRDYDLNVARNQAATVIDIYFGRSKIGGSLQHSDLTSAVAALPAVDYVNASASVRLPGMANAGRVTASLIPYPNESSLQIWRFATKLWEVADGGMLIVDGVLSVILDVADGAVEVRLLSTYEDVYLRREQSLARGTMTIVPHKTNRPVG